MCFVFALDVCNVGEAERGQEAAQTEERSELEAGHF